MQIGMQNGTLWKTFWSFLTKLNIFLPYDSVIMLLVIYSKELNTNVHIKTCTCLQQFYSILLKLGKQPRYPLAGEWTISCGISSTKMNGLSNHEKTQKES